MLETDSGRVLVIEDDPTLANTLRQGLSEAGYQVDLATDGEDGFFRALQSPPDLLVLDLNLPGRDGLDILATLRRHHPGIRVLIVSARDDVNDRVRGLDTGADDYLIKPFSFGELLARLRALTRRDRGGGKIAYRIRELDIDLLTRRVTRNGRPLTLTAREFSLLELLARHEGHIVSRQMLAAEVWPAARATPLDNVIDVHMMHLRRKLDGGEQPPLLHTVRGLGFVLGGEPPASAEP